MDLRYLLAKVTTEMNKGTKVPGVNAQQLCHLLL